MMLLTVKFTEMDNTMREIYIKKMVYRFQKERDYRFNDELAQDTAELLVNALEEFNFEHQLRENTPDEYIIH